MTDDYSSSRDACAAARDAVEHAAVTAAKVTGE